MILLFCLVALVAMSQPATVPPTVSSSSVIPTNGIATTAATIAPRMCYKCNSGSRLPGRSYNGDCAENGTISDKYIPVPCSCDFCLSAVGSNPAGSVFRGCGDVIYIRKHEKVTPGCSIRGNRYVCLCDSDGCNNQDLRGKAAEYLVQYGAAEATNMIV